MNIKDSLLRRAVAINAAFAIITSSWSEGWEVTSL